MRTSFDFKFPLSVQEIERLIPHRYPFLLLDRVTSFVPMETAAGQKNVSANEGFFQGHFPGNPIMPGVLVLEAMAQLGAVFAKLCLGPEGKDKLIVFSGAEDVRFRRVVVPGDVLQLDMNLVKVKFGHWKVSSRAKVDGEMAAEALLTATELVSRTK